MFKQRPNERGLTLIELLVGMGLLSLLLVLGLSSLRIRPTTGRSQGLASEVKGLFSQARAQAASTGVPVGIVFPTSGGDTPIVTECAIVRGTENGVLQRRLSFEGNYPGTGIFVGEWALPAGQTFAVPSPPTGVAPPRFSMANWLPSSMSGHAAYIFLPSGQIVTNAQTAIGGEFPLVVANGFSATPGPTATLGSATDAYTVLVSERATTRFEKGVVGGLVPEGGEGEGAWTLATLTPDTPPLAAPEITSVEVLPAPIDPVFAASRGAECVIEQGGVVTLKVTASDADGGPLFCRWSAEEGGLSHPAETPMLYSPEEDAWVSEWHWTPPANAAVDDIYPISVAVRDKDSDATTAADVIVNPRVLVVDKGILAFNSFRHFSSADDDQRSHVFAVRFDGTNLRAICESLSTAGFEGGLAPSWDGRRIAVGCDYSDPMIKLMSADGAESKLVNMGNDVMRPCFSPDSNRVFMAVGDVSDSSTWTFRVLSFDSSGNPVITNSPYNGHVVGWSPDGTEAMVETIDGDLLVCDSTGATLVNLYSASGVGGPAKGLDWNAQGLFYAINQSTLDLYPTEPGTFDITKTDRDGSAHQAIGRYRSCSDIGGNGRYVFSIGRDLMQTELATGASRVIVPGFFAPGTGGFAYGLDLGPMWQAAKHLSSSI